MDNRTDSFDVGNVITLSWEKVYGAKGTFMAALGMIVIIAIFMGIISAAAEAVSGFLGGLTQLIAQIIIALLGFGNMYIGIRRARGLPITYKQMFRTIDVSFAIHLLLAYLCVTLACAIPAAIFILLGTLLAIMGGAVGALLAATAYLFCVISIVYMISRTLLTYAFILDRGMGAWEAFKSSFECTKGHVLAIFALAIVQIVAYLIGIILLGIGLIWAIPFYAISYGLLYVQLSDKKYPVPAVVTRTTSSQG